MVDLRFALRYRIRVAGYERLGSVLSQQLFNNTLNAIERQNLAQHGRGVVSGLELSAGAGLTLLVSAGEAVGHCWHAFPAAELVIPPETEAYVWLEEDGTLSWSTAEAPPGPSSVCLGFAATGEAEIRSVSSRGRMPAARWTNARAYSLGEALRVETDTGLVGIGGSLLVSARGDHPEAPESGVLIYCGPDGLSLRRSGGDPCALWPESTPQWRLVQLVHDDFREGRANVPLSGLILHAVRVQIAAPLCADSAAELAVEPLGLRGRASTAGEPWLWSGLVEASALELALILEGAACTVQPGGIVDLCLLTSRLP